MLERAPSAAEGAWPIAGETQTVALRDAALFLKRRCWLIAGCVAGALALGLLAVAFVKLAGGSSSSHRPAAAGLRATPTTQSGAPASAGAAGLGGTSTPATVPGTATGAPSATGSVPAPPTGAGVARGAPGSGSTGAVPTTPVAPPLRAGAPPASSPGARSSIPSRAEQERLRKLLRQTR